MDPDAHYCSSLVLKQPVWVTWLMACHTWARLLFASGLYALLTYDLRIFSCFKCFLDTQSLIKSGSPRTRRMLPVPSR